jgi:Bacterial capsule synthesis protein PGA_cap
MTNLDSAWQSSVVQLAQQGNLKAITFWLNRYLVPQGMCAQIIPQQPGLLLIRVVCHRLPDGDRLIHFIRQRFFELNSDLIQVLRITAQMLGSPDVLWEQAVPVRFAAPPAVGQPVSQPIQSSPYPASPSASQPIAVTPPSQSSVHRPVAPPIQFASRPIPRTAPAGVKPTRRKKGRRYKLRAGSPIAKLRVQFYIWSDATIDRLFELKANTVRATRRSQRWFKSRPLEVRALLLGGSAATAIATVCGIQVLSQHLSSGASSESGGLWGATLTADTPKPHIDQSGTVTAALEQVPVIRQAVANPADPTVTLVFGSNGAIGGTQSVPTFQQADLLITNLDNSLAGGAPTEGSSSPTAASPAPTTPLPSATKLTVGKASSPSTEPAGGGSSPAVTDSASVKDSASMLVSSASFLGSLSAPPEAADPAEAAEPTTPPDSRKATIAELLANGVDVVNLAADSVIASGNLEQTLSSLTQKAIYPVGAGQNQQTARRPQIFEVKGQKIALLGYSDSDLHAATAQTAGMNASLNSQVEADIKAIRNQVDWVIVSYHWNKALRAYPEDSQLNLSRTAIDQGADLVVGYAPQVTQGAEIYQGRAIVYSLGDAIEEIGNTGTKNTAVLKVALRDKQIQLELLPVQIQQNQPALVEGEAATRINSYLQQASSLFDHPFRSPVALDAHLRLSLPVAPDSQLPTEPFLSYPNKESPESSQR